MSEKSGSNPTADVSAPCRARPGFALKKKPPPRPYNSTRKPKFPLITSHFNEGRFQGSEQYMFLSDCKQASTEM